MSDQAASDQPAEADHAIDLSDAGQVRQRKRTLATQEAELDRVLDVVLRSTEGRKLLWLMLSGELLGSVGFGVMSDPFVQGDPHFSAYRMGQQSAQRVLMALLMNPKRMRFYVQMVEENSTS